MPSGLSPTNNRKQPKIVGGEEWCLINLILRGEGKRHGGRSWKALEIVYGLCLCVTRAVTRPLLKTNQPFPRTGTNISLITWSGHKGSYRERKQKNWISKDWNQDGDESDLQRPWISFYSDFFVLHWCTKWHSYLQPWMEVSYDQRTERWWCPFAGKSCLFPRKLMHILPHH